MVSPLDCDACYICGGCNLPTCADETPSPREGEHICADCAPVVDE